MKRNLFIIALCLLSVATFAQKKKRTATTKRRVTPVTQAPATTPDATPTTGVASNASATLQDTTAKKTPMKPFDRPLDGYYKKTNILSAKVTPYPNLRESDVIFAKRVWQEIDLREKMNNYMASPKSRLIDVLMDAITAGELTAYDATPTKDDPNGDSFAHPLKPGEIKGKMLVDSSLVKKFDKDGNVISSGMVAGEFVADSIVRFRIKEDWIFDKQRSIYEPRIIGLAPLVKPKTGGNDINVDYQPAFWVYFPEARQVFVTKEVSSKDNDATGLSYDDVFMKRLFTSYIVKQSNNKDERIKDYAQGIDRLYESQKIKKEIMDWELDLWQY